MKVMIVGGGGLGFDLAQLLVKEKHDVVVVEKNDKRAEMLGESLDALVLHGDGTDRKTLKDGSIRKADALIAMTGDDKTNLMVCELAREFKVGSVVSRVLDSTNEPIFSKLGIASINTKASSVMAFKRVIERPGTRTVSLVAGDKAEVFERVVDTRSKAAGKKVGDFSKESFTIAAIFRSGTLVRPSPKSVIQPGDTLVIVAPVEEVQKIDRLF